MRSTPLIGKRPWFGPRRLGWGWDPVSAEGWVVIAAAVAASIAARRSGGTARAGRALLAVLLAIMVLKGTSPGGPQARREFDELRDAT